MEPFRFVTEAQSAREAASVDAALAHACSADLPDSTKSRLLAGVAGRPDLGAGHIKTILKVMQYQDHSTIATLLANPAVHARPKLHATARRYFSPYIALVVMSRLGAAAEEYLPELLTTRSGDDSLDSIVRREISTRFTPTQIGAGVDRLVDTFEAEVTGQAPEADGARSLSGLDPMTATQLHRVADLIVAALAGPEPQWPGARTDRERVAEQALIALLQRTDLPDEDCLRLVQATIALIERDTGSLMPGEHTYEHAYEQTEWYAESQTRRLLEHANLTPEAAALAFTSPALRLAPTILGKVGPEMVCAAIRAGAPRPLTLLADYLPIGRVPIDVLTIVLDAAKGGAAHQPYRRNGRGQRVAQRDPWDVLLRPSIDHIGTDYWETLYAAYLADRTASGLSRSEAIDAFTLRVSATIINSMDHGAVPDEHIYAAWASQSADAYLRAQAVQFCWEAAQLDGAGADPAAVVRLRVLSHPLARVSDVERAIGDLSATVRLAAVEHELAHPGLVSSLGDDPSSRVRKAAARRTMDTLRADAG